MEMEAVGSPAIAQRLTFTVLASGDLRVDDSRVLIADIAASNGVIHIIDSVLVPAEIAAMLAPAEAEMGEAPTQNIVEIAAGNPDFSTLVSLVSAAGLVDVLADPNASWTVFAPTNDAFSRVPQAVLDKLAADPALLTRS